MLQREHSLIPGPVCSEIVQWKVKEKYYESERNCTSPIGFVQRGDFQKANFLVSKDCQFSGPVPEILKREAWMGMNKNLKRACPNLDYHFHVDRVDGLNGHLVKISAELKGTHSCALDLSPVGLGVSPATDKSFASPREHVKVTIKDSKVASWVAEPIEGGGLMGILGQLGLSVLSL